MYEIGKRIKTQAIKGIQVHKLNKNKALEILCIIMEKGSILPEHISPKDATLIVMEGALDFKIEGKSFLLYHYEDFMFPKEIPHSVRAKENSRFLIIR
ncbi:hypothetical protein [Lentiprolixibacter aurantiacus]|uniref:Cupin domain-containing protein n=1 Tax=Lentiprolixibacter aurantiacus TaxID=2993939 RepID=A0AAE3MJW0_9FLAO|nr:hypothetical protein [Lentiprolixibacter aurantiacus]MCX2718768.1 hypothetical protein [Lentiprolixibacter aurantiacus]